MAAFKNEPEVWQRLDWMILRNGWACLYFKPEFLLIDTSWFRQERYRVLEFNCTTWVNEAAIHEDLKRRFRFGASYEATLEALKASLSEHDVTGGGLALVLHHFDAVEKKLGQAILAIFAEKARYHLLLGERVVTMVQVDDAHAKYDAVGAMPVVWNPHEWVK